MGGVRGRHSMPPDTPGTAHLETPRAHDLPPLPAVRTLLLTQWAGRLLLGGLVVRLLLALLAPETDGASSLDLLRRLSTLALIVGSTILLWRLSRALRHRPSPRRRSSSAAGVGDTVSG